MKQATKQRKRKGYIRTVLLVLIIIIAARSYINVKENSPKTVLAQYGEIRIEEKVNGVVVRRELLIRAPISGRISYLTQEKVRVPCNAKLVEVIRDRIGDDVLERYREISQRLKTMEAIQQEELVLPDQERVQENINNIVASIQEGDLLEVYSEKGKLKKEIYYKGASQRDRLMEEKNRLEQIIQEGVKSVYSSFAGIPVYSIDGYEEILTPEHLAEIKPQELKPKELSRLGESKSVKAGKPLLKLVDNHCWYLVARLSREFAEGLRKDSAVTLDFLQEGYQRIEARVKELKEGEEGTVLAFEIKDYVPGMLEERFMEVAIVKARYYGYIIPKEALLHRNGDTLVQVLAEGKAVNKKVVVKGSDQENAVISTDERESQLKLYDRVIINPGKSGRDGHEH